MSPFFICASESNTFGLITVKMHPSEWNYSCIIIWLHYLPPLL